MKLFSRLYRLNLFATFVIFLLAAFTYYLLVRYVVLDQFDDTLQNERAELEHYVAKYNHLPQIIPIKDQLTTFTKTSAFEKSSVKSMIAFDTVGRDTAEFRKLFFSLYADRNWYRVMIGKSMERTEHLMRSVISITIGTILMILLVSTAINRVVLRKLWRPFYAGLQLMKKYEVGSRQHLTFPRSDTEEFQFMNTVLEQVTRKADHDYLMLKEFTESASHEMQTPLAIIRSKMDLLIQDEKIPLTHSKNLKAMYHAIEKLNSLNHSLLLLTKIGNNQFANQEIINVCEAVIEKNHQFEEIINARQIRLFTSTADIFVTMNDTLFDTLLNNLYSNAIRHNRFGGCIDVTMMKPKILSIANTADNYALDNGKIFSRFYKPNESSQTGLGLSIIKEICQVSGCAVTYNYEGGKHFFIIQWE